MVHSYWVPIVAFISTITAVPLDISSIGSFSPRAPVSGWPDLLQGASRLPLAPLPKTSSKTTVLSMHPEGQSAFSAMITTGGCPALSGAA